MALREMTLGEIQDFSLVILDEFDAFCRKNNLRYTLAYGTLIGAIRHKGFIPWDDDVDVLMPRPDYDRLMEIYEDNKDYILLYPGKNNCSISYARLCDISRTRVISKSPFHNGENGVWIDIFPADAAPEDPKAAQKKFLKSHNMFMSALRRRRTIRYRNTKGLSAKLKYALNVLTGNTGATEFAVKMDAFCKEIPYGTTSVLSSFTAPKGKKLYTYKTGSFEEYMDTEFCGKTYMIVKDYDSCLRVQYGDYMQLPPESERTPLHDCHGYLWL